ncbi:hypothetical protein MXD59_13020 [Frankia sp. Ag45/Mut15]|uniref:Serine protease n=1 Tax=Frankia umida TaxID=573489 RepID=A0ABT0JZN6_9ACTN|nr:hypothetical protein [Frankia umida]MCK9876687.1 hypothetical protein [Frankia umida]
MTTRLYGPWPQHNMSRDTVGRLFIRDPATRVRAWYTATVVTSPGRNLLVTAAHCLFGQKDAQMVFVPGYDHGRAPFGLWPVVSWSRLAAFADSGPSHFDIGFATVGNMYGHEIADLVGSQGISFGQDRHQFVTVLGYDRQDAGSPLRYCSGWTVNGVLLSESRSTALICRLVQGSSGGPRYSTLDDRTGAGTIFSINSFGVTVYFEDGSTDRNEYFWGTYLGDEAYRLYASVAVVAP